MSVYSKEYFIDLIKMSREERRKRFEECCSITDIENQACDLYHKTMELRRNLGSEAGEGKCEKENDLLKDFLGVRRSKLDRNFTWTENYKRQFLELNEKIMNGFSMAYDEAKTQFDILKDRMKRNDPYINGFNIDIKLIPFILEQDEDEHCLAERGEGIYYILYNALPDTLWTESVYYEQDLDDSGPKKYENDGSNYNANEYLGKGNFDDSFICWAMYELLASDDVLSWYDILRINEIWVEVKVTHQHFIENIGERRPN